MSRVSLHSAARVVLSAVLAAAALVVAFDLLVDDSLFAILWHRPGGLALYSGLFLTTLLTVPLLLVPFLRAAGCAILAAVGGTLAGLQAVAHDPGSSAIGLGVLVLGASARWAIRRLGKPEEGRRLATGIVMVAGISGLVGGTVLLRRATAAPRPFADLVGTAPEARRYANDAFRFIREQSLWRDTVSWDRLADSAAVLLRGAQSGRDARPAVEYLLAALGDHHSGLDPVSTASTGAAPALTPLALESRLPTVRLLDGGIGYIEVPWFVGSLVDAALWRRTLIGGIVSVDADVTCGWVVDLRRNFGGDMWPMLEGIAPLLPDGRAGGVWMPRRRKPAAWWIVGGHAYSAVPVLAGLPLRSPRRLRHGTAPVAVLYDRRTASSGEAIAIAFVGRPDTRSFGESTAGLTSSNTSRQLPDGARMALTVGVDVDRSGRRYGGALIPDESVTESAPPPAVPQRALTWLHGRCAAIGGAPARLIPDSDRRRGAP